MFEIFTRTGLSLANRAHVVGGFHSQEVKAGLRLLLLRCFQGSSFLTGQATVTYVTLEALH